MINIKYVIDISMTRKVSTKNLNNVICNNTFFILVIYFIVYTLSKKIILRCNNQTSPYLKLFFLKYLKFFWIFIFLISIIHM